MPSINEIELTLWLCVSVNFNIIFWLLMRSYDKSCQSLLKTAKDAIKLARDLQNLVGTKEFIDGITKQSI